MKNITVLMFLILTWSSCFSQGGWDIGYIVIDSVNQDEIGKDIKLDFRNASDTNKTVSEFLMRFIGQEDSATISLEGKAIMLKEARNIHLDWGFYNEQFLMGSKSDNKIIKIYHSVIEEQNQEALLVRLYIEVYWKYKKGKSSNYPNARYCASEWIPRKKLNGVMIKE